MCYNTGMENALFEDPIYSTFTEEQAEWAVSAWNTVLLYRGIIPGRIPTDNEIARLKEAAPGVLNGSPQEDAGYILDSASQMYD